MHIDHLVYATPDLDAAVDHLASLLGVRPAGGGRHVGVGTHNALLDLGDRTYLEVIAPDPDQPSPGSARPFGVDGLAQPRLAGWAVAVDDIDAAVAAARARGFDPGEPASMSRVTTEGVELRWRLTRNATAGGAVPFLISWGGTEHPSTTAPHGVRLDALAIAHPDPDSVRPAFEALELAVPVEPGPRFELVARLEGPAGHVELR